MENKEILTIAANALSKKKALQLSALKIDDLTVLTEYFLIATATSSTHVRALADEVEVKLEEAGVRPHHIEGRQTGWIILDYEGVIVHVFNREQRAFYDLDKMWADGTPVELAEILTDEEEQ